MRARSLTRDYRATRSLPVTAAATEATEATRQSVDRSINQPITANIAATKAKTETRTDISAPRLIETQTLGPVYKISYDLS